MSERTGFDPAEPLTAWEYSNIKRLLERAKESRPLAWPLKGRTSTAGAETARILLSFYVPRLLHIIEKIEAKP